MSRKTPKLEIMSGPETAILIIIPWPRIPEIIAKTEKRARDRCGNEILPRFSKLVSVKVIPS
jgi:hypothetical protein